jgi:hypothetical protein
MLAKDWGVVFELDGTAITTSYQAPPAITRDQLTGRGQRRRFSILAHLKTSGTNITGIKAKAQASADGSSWYDIETIDDASATQAVEHDYTTIVSHVINGSFYTDGGFRYMRVQVKADGGAGQATETLQVLALDAIVSADSISTAMLQDGAVATAKIADGAVTAAKLGANAVVQLRTQRIQYTDLTDAVSGEAQAVNVGAVLPAGAVILGHEVKLDAQFAGGSVSACTLKLGGTNTTAIVNGFDVKGSTAGGHRYAPGYAHLTSHGDHCTGLFSAEQLVATFTPTSDSLSHLTAGDLTVNVWFVVP